MPFLPSDSLPLNTARVRVRRKQARPAELLEAALDLFIAKGYAATKVEAVAARAGVSKGTLFLYFPQQGRSVQCSGAGEHWHPLPAMEPRV